MAPNTGPHTFGNGHRTPWGTIFAFLFPALTFFVALTAYPAIRTLWNSFHEVLPRKEEFIGLTNYAELAVDDIYWQAVKNTFVWASCSPLIEVFVALLLALALYAKIPGARFFRVAWFTPVLMSYIVVGILWIWIFNYDWGPINTVLRAIGLDAFARPWLIRPRPCRR